MRRLLGVAPFAALFVSTAAFAQPAEEPPPPSAPAPGALVPPPVQPGYDPPNGGYRGEYAPPGYAPGYGYRYAPPLPPPPTTCCRWSARIDPFDLVYRRLTFLGEIAVTGPFAVQAEGSWIFGSAEQDTDAKGFALGGDVAYYLGDHALRGFWFKAHGGYERYTATVTDTFSLPQAQGKGTLSSAVIGALFGNSIVFGRDGGFTLSIGIGIGYATAPEKTITAVAKDGTSQTEEFYTGLNKVRLLGSASLGVTL